MLPPSFLPLRVFALFSSTLVHLTRASSPDSPLVSLDYGTFRGFVSAGSTESFLGMPFAKPPLGDLRFHHPVSPQPFSGVQNATWFGNACPQQPFLGPNQSFPHNPGLNGVIPYIVELLPGGVVSDSEDCLYINVIRPAGVSAGDKLPVVVWAYGGGFAYGDASAYNGTQIVSRSIDLNLPIIYVSFNYRMNAFGFLGGKEVQAAGLGNIGLYDQRFALKWVQKYIPLFGGNPKQVVMWGESAGAISAMLQMVGHDGKLGDLFHGAVLESGAASPMQDITSSQSQYYYDFLVQQTSCTSAVDTLDCLRRAPYQTVIDAVLQTPAVLSYQGVAATWHPLVDGVFLKQSIRRSLSQGKYAHVPAIFGSVDDEGTSFSLYSLNVTSVTDDQFLEYIKDVIFHDTTEDDIKRVGELYPNDPTLGSPFDVGTNDTLTPQYKRISALQGDYYFHVPRRYALEHLSQTQNVWSFLWKRYKFVPGIGSFHGSDLQEFYNLTGSTDWMGTDSLVNFAHTLDPNVPRGGYPSGAAPSRLSDINWPQYTHASRELLTMEDPDVLTLSEDVFRSDAMAFLDEIQYQTGL